MLESRLAAIIECLRVAREEVEASFRRTFDLPLELSTDAPAYGPAALDRVRSALEGRRSLVAHYRFDDFQVEVCIGDGERLFPDWVNDPDATGLAKLATFAQELGILLFPPEWSLLDSSARVVSQVPRGGLSGELPEQVLIPAKLAGAESRIAIIVMAPTTPSGQRKQSPAAQSEETTVASQPGPSGAPQPGKDRTGKTARMADPRARLLPLLTRSLLKIKLPVEVILARTRKPLADILQLGPGTIIQFEKSCDEPLELAVNGYVIARGEAVKVGDKFGLRILEMTLPPERHIVLSAKMGRRTGTPFNVSSYQ